MSTLPCMPVDSGDAGKSTPVARARKALPEGGLKGTVKLVKKYDIFIYLVLNAMDLASGRDLDPRSGQDLAAHLTTQHPLGAGAGP